jgi:hypothetical protein|tara:strand:- start:162 stop:410 length:249 start_codon:yes stop_codon:yes gene_type:complete
MGLFGKKEKKREFWIIAVKSNDRIDLKTLDEPIYEDKKQAENHIKTIPNRYQHDGKVKIHSMKFTDEDIKGFQERGSRFVFK